VCSHYSNTFDVFCDLSLPMPKRGSAGGVALRECLDLFSQEERLDEDNAPVRTGSSSVVRKGRGPGWRRLRQDTDTERPYRSCGLKQSQK